MINDPATELIRAYFPEISSEQFEQYSRLTEIYRFWNEKINVISRKDLDNLIVRHVLHSLSIAKVLHFQNKTNVLDVGTGGGFPGIPLAVMFPEVQFTLIDSIAKKIKVVQEVAEKSGLRNVRAIQANSKNFKGKFNYITGRAVTSFPVFYNSVKHLFKNSAEKDALVYLKGGDFQHETEKYKGIETYNIKDFFSEDFFQTKKIIVLKQK